MSPQQHRGHSAQQGHKKPAPRPASAAAPKPATGASALPPAQSLPAAQSLSGKPGKAAPAPAAAAASTASKSGSAPAAKYASDAGSDPKAAEQGRRRAKASTAQTESRPLKRRGSFSGARRNPMLTGAWAYLKAFMPLIMVVVLGTVAIVAWTTWGPKTESPTQAWTRIESKWAPERAAALKEIGSAGSDAQAQLKGYQHLRDATRGWITDLEKITDWTDTAPSSAAAGESTKSVQQMVSFGKQEADYIDAMTTSNLSEKLPQLYNIESTFGQARDQARSLVIGTTSSPEPTLPALPTAPPSPDASGSPAPSASPAS